MCLYVLEGRRGRSPSMCWRVDVEGHPICVYMCWRVDVEGHPISVAPTIHILPYFYGFSCQNTDYGYLHTLHGFAD